MQCALYAPGAGAGPPNLVSLDQSVAVPEPLALPLIYWSHIVATPLAVTQTFVTVAT